MWTTELVKVVEDRRLRERGVVHSNEHSSSALYCTPQSDLYGRL
jgi:hypothetical protein